MVSRFRWESREWQGLGLDWGAPPPCQLSADCAARCSASNRPFPPRHTRALRPWRRPSSGASASTSALELMCTTRSRTDSPVRALALARCLFLQVSCYILALHSRHGVHCERWRVPRRNGPARLRDPPPLPVRRQGEHQLAGAHGRCTGIRGASVACALDPHALCCCSHRHTS